MLALFADVWNALTFNDSIIDPLFGCENHVKVFFSLLKPLRLGFDPPIPVQHVQYAILCVSDICGQGPTHVDSFIIQFVWFGGLYVLLLGIIETDVSNVVFGASSCG